MFKVDFYRDIRGRSDIEELLENLRKKRHTNKRANTEFKQIVFYIELLQKSGTWMGEPQTKNVGQGLWELRPGNNRILYFYFEKETYVLLHHFVKKTNRTPLGEIDRAKREMNDHIKRKKGGT